MSEQPPRPQENLPALNNEQVINNELSHSGLINNEYVDRLTTEADTHEKIEALQRELMMGKFNRLKDNPIVKELIDTTSPRALDQFLRNWIDYDRLRGEIDYLLIELKASPKTAEAYEAIMLREDPDFLKEKSEQQRDQLRELYFGELPEWLQFAKRNKLKVFEDFIEQLDVVIGGTPAIKDIDQFKSPQRTGVFSSYGASDVLVRAERYVYASFRQISHHMAGGTDQRVIDSENIAKRSQIVMQDISNMGMRASKTKQGRLGHYLNNLFDYQTGKEILALYCAYVFDTPEEASKTINANNQSSVAQHWDSIFSYGKDKVREQQILTRMEELLEMTDIEPPLSLEVRIRDFADPVKK